MSEPTTGVETSAKGDAVAPAGGAPPAAAARETGKRSAMPAPRLAPFLVWPVARREFYVAICMALLPTLAWGVVVFGWRALADIAAIMIGALGSHYLLHRFTYRGKRLLFAHTAGSALLVAALAQPIWPASLMLLAGGGVTLLLFIWGGPGHERVPSATFVAVVLLFVAPRVLHFPPAQPDVPTFGERILVRDRLVMGDLRDVPPPPAAAPSRWLLSRENRGDDAVPMFNPARVAHRMLDAISRSAEARTPEEKLMTWHERTARITPEMDDVLVTRLPALERVAFGSVPGPIGCVSGICIGVGGLYLAYRNILRPRSFLLFIAAFLGGLWLFVLKPETLGQIGFIGMFRVWQAVPSYLMTFWAYSFFASDALFAAVFMLAWPGTEPISRRGRRTFVVIAGLIAAAVHRYSPTPLPAATLTLTCMQPLADLFDRAFRHRSWLNR